MVRNEHFLYRRLGVKNVFWLLAFMVALFMFAGCSTVSMEGARQLSVLAKDVAVMGKANIFASEDEFNRSLDAEELFHGIIGAEETQTVLKMRELYQEIQNELTARQLVFASLESVYTSFAALAVLDSAVETENAINNLGGAINSYAAALGKSSSDFNTEMGVIANVGGVVAGEIQKNRIKESSALIRKRLAEFYNLLGDPLVREQTSGFKLLLGTNRHTAITMLWEKGVYQPDTLLNDFGADAGLTVQKDAAKIVLADSDLREGLNRVISRRLSQKLDLVENGYDSSLAAIKNLILEHQKLEAGQELDLASVRLVVSDLQRTVSLLSK